MPTDQQNILKTNSATTQPEVFSPSQEVQDFVMKVYDDFSNDFSLKNQSWEVLNNRSLSQFWQDSNYDYNQIVVEDANNPVVQYSSGVTRDKANTFITNLTLQMLYPSVTAINDKQQIDTTISQIAKPILKWQYVNDGRPSESGKIKNVRYTHKQVIEGTVHILDTIGADGKLTSMALPNEEVFVPNFYQPNVQLQAHFMHVQQYSSYAEAKAEFGALPNFKYVTSGSLGWVNQTYAFKEKYKAIVYQDQCTIIRVWYPVSEEELTRLKKIGKLPKHVTKAKYFNVIINSVPMFAYDNLMPYYHGDYPVTKAVFEWFSPSEFYWGNSMPNKCAQDKHFKDGWMTLMRYAAKLSAIPALINFTGQHIENNIVVPGLMTDMPATFDPTKIVAVPGTDKGVTNGMVQMFNQTEQEINRSTASPQTSGQQSGRTQTARETLVIEQNEQKILLGFAQQLTFREEARAFPILKSSFQFLPRQTIKQLSIPNQTFQDGSAGTLEIIFEKLPPMTEDAKLQASHELLKLENKSKKGGNPFHRVYVNPEYIQNVDLYCEAVAEELPAANSSFKEARAQVKWETYKQDPDVFNKQQAARNLVRQMGDNEQELIVAAPPMQQSLGPTSPGGQPSPLSPPQLLPGTSTQKQQLGRENQTLNFLQN